MVYRHDIDLEFLENVSSEDLNQLVYILTHDIKDKKTRWAEKLTSNNEYKKYAPDHHKYWHLIAAELQSFGANSVATLFRRGKGVEYKEILTDVCDKMNVNYNKKDLISKIEQELLAKVLETAWEDMTSIERENFLRGINTSLSRLTSRIANIADVKSLLGLSGIIGYIVARTAATVAIAPYMTAGSVSGMVLAALILPRVAALPIAIATMPFLIWQVAGEAYRVTIPACILVATLRKKYELSSDDIVRIRKYDALIEKFRSIIESYQRSDKKKFGLYVFASLTSQFIESEMSDDEIKCIIFSLDQEDQNRIMNAFLNELRNINNFEDSIIFARKECHCCETDITTVFEMIIGFSIEETDKKKEASKILKEILKTL